MDERTVLIDQPAAEGDWFAVRVYDRRRKLVRWIHHRATSADELLAIVAGWRAEDEFRASAEVVVLRAPSVAEAEARVRAWLS